MLPTFLGIGSQRCGTSWLYRGLVKHPQVRMGRTKEVNFFYQYLRQRDLHWYEDQFADDGGKPDATVIGEITPNYSKLKPAAVRAIHRLLPDVRLVYLIRDPVERTWKQALLERVWVEKKPVQNMTVGQFLRRFERARTRRYTDYVSVIRTWRDVYGREPLLIETQDRIVNDAVGLYIDVLKHLGADPDRRPADEVLTERKGQTYRHMGLQEELPMPEEVRWYLSSSWLPMARELDPMIEGRARPWIERMEAAVGHPRSWWRVRRALNRTVLRLPEAVAYGLYDAKRDVDFKRRFALIHRQAAERGATPSVLSASPA